MAKSELDAAVAAVNTQGRKTMGDEGRKFTSPSASPEAGTLIPKKNTAAGDPTGAGTKANRVNEAAAPGGERKGAAYSSSGISKANGRVVSPSVTRQRDSWAQGIETSY